MPRLHHKTGVQCFGHRTHVPLDVFVSLVVFASLDGHSELLKQFCGHGTTLELLLPKERSLPVVEPTNPDIVSIIFGGSDSVGWNMTVIVLSASTEGVLCRMKVCMIPRTVRGAFAPESLSRGYVLDVMLPSN